MAINFLFMKYLKLFCLFLIFEGYSQTTSVEYKYYTNFGIPINSIWVLTFNKNESYFYESNKKAKITEDSFKEQGEFFKNFDVKKENIKYVDIKSEGAEFYYTNFQTDSLYHQDFVVDDIYYVHEQIPKLKWNIMNEFKTIENYKCQKAITQFRGRTYEAWFTTEIPTLAGPLKFTGLPGMILTLKDNATTVVLKATRITKKPDVNLQDEVTSLEIKGKRIALKDFVPIKDNEGEALIKKIRAKSGERNTVSYFQKPSERQGLEKVYEWEDEKKD